MTRPILILGAIGFLAGVTPTSPHAANGTVAVSGIASDFLDQSREHWDLGLGLGLSGTWRVSNRFDLRGDVGARWYEGSGRGHSSDGAGAPRWGQEAGESTDGLRMIPTTASLVYRFEDWSRGRYWLPYAAAGAGLYDFEARYVTEADQERTHNLFRFGWHARAGVRLERTSGLFMQVESAVHAVDVPGRWTNLYDLSFGVGGFFPAR